MSFFLKLNQSLIYGILLFISFPTSSNEVVKTYGLFIKPKSCVIEAKNHHCEANIEVLWELKNKRNVCLYIEGRNRALACWQNKSTMSEFFSIDISKNVDFQLRDEITNQIIYSSRFSLYLKLVKYRKKRRNPWSFY